MKHGEMMALSNRGGTRTPLERASAWLLAHVGAGRYWDTAGWVSARDIEVARSKTGVSRAALNRARRWLPANRRHRETAPRLSRSMGVSSGSPRSPGTVRCAVQSTVCWRRPRSSRCRQPSRPSPQWRSVTSAGGPGTPNQLYGTGLMWHGYGDIQPLADTNKARRMAQNHPDVYELVEVESD